MTEPIYGFVRREWAHLATHLPHYHHTQAHQEAPVSNALIDAIERDLGGVSNEIHQVLTHHLAIENVAFHVAKAVASAAGSPLAPIVETAAGLPPSVQGAVARITAGVAAELGALIAGAAPPPEPVPVPEPDASEPVA